MCLSNSGRCACQKERLWTRLKKLVVFFYFQGFHRQKDQVHVMFRQRIGAVVFFISNGSNCLSRMFFSNSVFPRHGNLRPSFISFYFQCFSLIGVSMAWLARFSYPQTRRQKGNVACKGYFRLPVRSQNQLVLSAVRRALRRNGGSLFQVI